MKAAHVYLGFGWAVVPLHDVTSGRCSCGSDHLKKDGTSNGSEGKHPRLNDWVKEASKDPRQVAEWQAEYPTGNIGIATGELSGFFVLDVDPDKGGDVTLEQLEEEHGTLPDTVQAITGSGGQHFLFKMVPGLANSAGRLGKGLDTRGNGGQIVVAPSRSAKGAYRWAAGSAPWERPILEAPHWLIELLAPRVIPEHVSAPVFSFPPATPEILKDARAALDAHGPAIDGEGGGRHTVHAAAILTHDYALTDEEAWPLFVEWNTTCEPPWELEGRESLRTMLGRGRKYGKLEYGCRRKLDPLAASKQVIEEWRAAGSSQDAIPAMVEKIRDVVAKGALPTERALIEITLKEATGLGVKSFALPPATRRVLTIPQAQPSYGFDISSSGAPIMNLNNVVIVLEAEKREFAFDTFSQRVVKENGKPWTDADTLELTLDLQRRIGLTKMTPQTTIDGVVAYARRQERNSVTEFLDGLAWDQEQRIAEFFRRAFGAADNEYTRSASQNFWRSLVARALMPGCKVDTMIVLEGPQGILKSSALQAIVGKAWFAEATESPHAKDFFQGLHGKWLIEIAELDSFGRADVTAVKRVLSCQSDYLRLPYGRVFEDFPRQSIFAGTTNRSDWNRDDTGARRFWPILCSLIDLAYIREHREQFFAEAVAEVQAGATWWEMPAEATAAEQEARRMVDPWEELLEQYIAQSEAKEFVVTDLLGDPLGLDVARMGKPEQMRIATILKRLGLMKCDAWRSGKKLRVWKRIT